MAAKIVGVSGSLRDRSYTLTLVRTVLEEARRLGGEVEMLDLREIALPMYEAHADYVEHPGVARVVELAKWADGFVVGSPEYHGCMSGATKNFFDFLYREIAGKVFALVSATGNTQGVSCFANMRAAIQACHGWSLPYNTGATGKCFDTEGKLTDARVLDRLNRMGRDLVIYAPLLHGRFKDDLAQPAGEPHGFAHWMG